MAKYLDVNDLRNEISSYQSDLNDSLLSADAKPSERFGQMCLDLTNHMLESSSFRGYAPELKEDMRSYGLERLMRAIQLVDTNRDNKSLFSYFSRTIHMAYLGVLKKYYADKEFIRKLTRETLIAKGASDEDIEGMGLNPFNSHIQENNFFNSKDYKSRDKRNNK